MSTTSSEILKNPSFNIKLIVGKGTLREQVSFFCKSSHQAIELISAVKSQANTIHADFDWSDFCKRDNLLKLSIWNAFISKGYKPVNLIIYQANDFVEISYIEYFNLFTFLAKRANITLTEIKMDGGIVVIGGAGLF